MVIGGAVSVVGFLGYAYSAGMFGGDALPSGMLKTKDAAFDAWIQKMAKSSPSDPKDTADFKFITFTEKPPFMPKHQQMAGPRTPE